MPGSPSTGQTFGTITLVFSISSFLTLYMIVSEERQILNDMQRDATTHEQITIQPIATPKEESAATDEKASATRVLHPFLKTIDSISKSYNNVLSKVPLSHNLKNIWVEGNMKSDRILEQLLFSTINSLDVRQPLRTIALHGTFDNVATGQIAFNECPTRECALTRTSDHTELAEADAILLGHDVSDPYPSSMRRPSQVWIYHNLESPMTVSDQFNISSVNWTASYRRDSTIVTPYEKFVLYNNSTLNSSGDMKDYSTGKVHKVAWFVSNCNDVNGRLSYARELSKYISVHIYGYCGDRKCPRKNEKQCFDMLKTNYKFYLAFENSNCKDYITEKFYRNALMNDVVPVVMGASKDEYEKVAPPESFIHVDDFNSPKQLAYYLHTLDQQPHLYNKFFRWKTIGTFINTHFFCRMCAMLHASPLHITWYQDIRAWWRNDTCAKPSKKRYRS